MGESNVKSHVPVVPSVPKVEAEAPKVELFPAPIAPVNGPVETQEMKSENQHGVSALSEFSKPGAVLALLPGAKATGEKLAKQPKVGIVIPLTKGEKAGVATEYVAINGYPFYIKKGVQVFVPQDVATLLLDLMGVEHSDSEFGRSMRADRTQVKDGVEVADRLRG